MQCAVISHVRENAVFSRFYISFADLLRSLNLRTFYSAQMLL